MRPVAWISSVHSTPPDFGGENQVLGEERPARGSGGAYKLKFVGGTLHILGGLPPPQSMPGINTATTTITNHQYNDNVAVSK